MGNEISADRELLREIHSMLRGYSADTAKVRDELANLRTGFALQQEQMEAFNEVRKELKEHLREAANERLLRLDKQKDFESRLSASERLAAEAAGKLIKREEKETISLETRNTELEILYRKLEKADKTNKITLAIAFIEFLGIIAVAVLK